MLPRWISFTSVLSFSAYPSAELNIITYKLHKPYYLSFLSPLGQQAAETESQTLELVHTDIHRILYSRPSYSLVHYTDQGLYYTASYPEDFEVIDQVPKSREKDGTVTSPSGGKTHRVARDLIRGLSGSMGPSFHLLLFALL